MIFFFPYNLGSQSVHSLRNALTSSLPRRPLLLRANGRYKARARNLVINWGNNSLPNWTWHSHNLNHPDAVKKATNKLLAFQAFSEHGVASPEFTTNREQAQEWVNNGDTIVVRHLLRSHGGSGISVVSEGSVPQAPLYTKYKKKRSEFRTHVFQGEVIDTVQKRKRNAAERPETFNNQIRSYDNGWVFCRNDITPDPNRDAVAIAAVTALGLDFGAVDIIYNEHENQYYVLEVNTAPGIEGTTIQRYVDKILSL